MIRSAFMAMLALAWACQLLHAQSSDDDSAAAPEASESSGASLPQPIPWSELGERERKYLEDMLADVSWPLRATALLRLERYSGAPTDLVRSALRDPAWQVRCFALHQSVHMRVDVTASDLEGEIEPAVIRTALRLGVKLPDEIVSEMATRLMRTKGIDELMLGLEIAAASEIEPLRIEAARRATTLIRNMSEAVAALVSRRLAIVVDIDGTPVDAGGWRAWLTTQRREVKLAPPEKARSATLRDASSLVAGLDDESFIRLGDYFDSLRQRELDLAIAMDSTTSMLPMINQARAGVDSLILFLGDISRSMRLAFIGYRDRDNPPVWDGHPFTTDIKSIRKYLFDIRITGGTTYPEAVLEGLAACTQLKWNDDAVRQVVLVGDAPPHDEDIYQVRALLEAFRDKAIVVHTVHVPMQYPPGYYDRLTPERARQSKGWLDEYNAGTEKTFAEIAELAGGRAAALGKPEGLVPAIMHFAIEESWWPVFDEFHAMYLRLCR